jgi:hypothetical protein
MSVYKWSEWRWHITVTNVHGTVLREYKRNWTDVRIHEGANVRDMMRSAWLILPTSFDMSEWTIADVKGTWRDKTITLESFCGRFTMDIRCRIVDK